MTSKDKKEYLSRATKLNAAINQKLEEIDQIRAMCEKMTASYSDMPKSPNVNTREDTYIRLITMQHKANDLTDEYIDTKQEIEAKIDNVEDITLRTLLKYRYLNHNKWEQIAESMNYSIRHIHELHGDALINIVI